MPELTIQTKFKKGECCVYVHNGDVYGPRYITGILVSDTVKMLPQVEYKGTYGTLKSQTWGWTEEEYLFSLEELKELSLCLVLAEKTLAEAPGESVNDLRHSTKRLYDKVIDMIPELEYAINHSKEEVDNDPSAS